ncbi:hypothetical protein DLA64_13205, partial [Salmonella enterica]|nr:hypothetical protein [Salmonella enterica]
LPVQIRPVRVIIINNKRKGQKRSFIYIKIATNHDLCSSSWNLTINRYTETESHLPKKDIYVSITCTVKKISHIKNVYFLRKSIHKLQNNNVATRNYFDYIKMIRAQIYRRCISTMSEVCQIFQEKTGHYGIMAGNREFYEGSGDSLPVQKYKGLFTIFPFEYHLYVFNFIPVLSFTDKTTLFRKEPSKTSVRLIFNVLWNILSHTKVTVVSISYRTLKNEVKPVVNILIEQ